MDKNLLDKTEEEKEAEYKRIIEELHKKYRRCYKCANFHEYYIEGIDRIKKTKFGYCTECKKDVKCSDTCKDYSYRVFEKMDIVEIEYQLDRVAKRLSKLLKLINEKI